MVRAFRLAEDPGDRHERSAIERETVFRLWVLLARELEKADAGNRQRLLFAKLRPSDLKLKTGPPLGPEGGKLKFIETSSTRLPDARITGAMSFDLDVVGLRQIAFALLRGIPTSSICIILQYSAHRTCCS